ncbi:NAD(P)-dependent oxidoreductase [Actinomadura rubrisoli]|uniref:NAD-dependent epimerase/dehydratase family protein n=1 Tax=Actinomadura rubrisoli TaxID=2530368 RepID=A0A4R5BRE7_9ACTN|nr:NAD(P)H-binding protein [Actinomadura rubrisoli]TDD89561.1 NAD-dependent epimerase/dehydratase family protein [Actinomadura rubrisoli]
MRLTVFGATGGAGVQVVRQALDAGHAVTAVVRNSGGLPAELRDRADVVTADVMDPGAIEEAVKGRDAVISAIGTREGRRPTTVCAASSASIIAAMRAAGAARFLMVSAAGVAVEPGDGPFTRYVAKPLIIQPLLRHGFADMRTAERHVRDSGLDWTIVRPPRLKDGPGKGEYRKAVDGAVPGRFSIDRADLATALLDLAADASSTGHMISVTA